MMGWTTAKRVRELEQQVERLEKQVSELRRQHLPLAELADVVTELVVPLASRDQERVDRAIERFNQGL